MSKFTLMINIPGYPIKFVLLYSRALTVITMREIVYVQASQCGNSMSPLLQLPIAIPIAGRADDALLHLLRLLPHTSLANLATTCSSFYSIIHSSHSLWQRLTLRSSIMASTGATQAFYAMLRRHGRKVTAVRIIHREHNTGPIGLTRLNGDRQYVAVAQVIHWPLSSRVCFGEVLSFNSILHFYTIRCWLCWG